MGSITSGVGLISGMNSGQLIDQLISIDSRPKTLLQNRIAVNTQIKVAYTDLQARLSSLLNTANLLVRPSTFQSATGTSSDSNVLGVNVSSTAAAGQYQFTVARTVTSQSMISSGYSSTDALVGAGTITVGLGGGEVTSSTSLADLNGGAGVRRGTFRITDKSGSSSAIDISSAVSLEDVVKKINTASNLQITASIGDNGLVLEDTSGGTGTIKIDEVGGGNAAADLGIKGTATGTSLTGTSINTIGRSTLLSTLNDGLGVRNRPGNTDLKITTADGYSKDITLTNKKTVGEVIDAINKDAAGKYVASLRSDGKGIKITDLTASDPSSTGELTIESLNGSNAVADLGLNAPVINGEVQGGAIRANLGSVLLKNLNGGTGIGGGSFQVTDRAGNSANVQVAGATSLSDIIQRINDAGTGVRASVNKSGTGIQLSDVSGGTGDFSVAGTGGAAASLLGIQGTYNLSQTTVDAGSLKRKYIGENTLLSNLAGGKGIAAGKFEIIASDGTKAEIDTTSFTSGSLGDLINAINAKGIGVTASVNDEGTGILLTDTANGSGKLNVKDLTGSAAADLRIAGTATTNTLDGAYSKTIDVTATDTLQSVLTKINSANAGITATIVNDGSGANPFRLSINANNTGLNGRFTLDGGSTSLSVDTLVSAQNAAVFLGSATASNPVLINSSSNTISNVMPGVSLNLLSASDKAINVSVSQTPDNSITQLKTFVTTFNDLSTKIAELTKFDTTTNAKGLLLGDATTIGITDKLFRSLNSTVSGAGRYNRLSQIGLTVGADNKLSFDEDKFRQAYSTDQLSVQRLFTAFNTVSTTSTTDKTTGKVTDSVVTTAFGTETAGTTTGTDANGNKFTRTIKVEGFGFATLIQNSLNKLNDPVDGTLVRQNKSIDSANELYQDRIDAMTVLLDAKKLRLQKQFANMESVLAELQSQQSSISQIQTISYS